MLHLTVQSVTIVIVGQYLCMHDTALELVS